MNMAEQFLRAELFKEVLKGEDSMWIQELPAFETSSFKSYMRCPLRVPHTQWLQCHAKTATGG